MKKFVLLSIISSATIILLVAATLRNQIFNQPQQVKKEVEQAVSHSTLGPTGQLLNKEVYDYKAPTDLYIKVFNKSVSLEIEKKYQAAIDCLLQLVKDYKGDYLLNLRLGWLYYNLKDNENSIKYYTIATSTDSASVEALLGLRLPYVALNKIDEAEKIYQKILLLDARNYEANLRLGIINYNNGKYEASRKYLELVNKKYPTDYECTIWLGWACLQLGDYPTAKKMFTLVLAINEDDSSALEGLKLIK